MPPWRTGRHNYDVVLHEFLFCFHEFIKKTKDDNNLEVQISYLMLHINYGAQKSRGPLFSTGDHDSEWVTDQFSEKKKLLSYFNNENGCDKSILLVQMRLFFLTSDMIDSLMLSLFKFLHKKSISKDRS